MARGRDEHEARTADRGTAARLIECASDRQLKGKCLRAGDRHVVVREADLAAVWKAVRRLGYVWPIPGD